MDLLAAQQLEKYASVDFAQRALIDLDKFLEARAQLRITSDEKCADNTQQGNDSDSFVGKKPSVVQMVSLDVIVISLNLERAFMRFSKLIVAAENKDGRHPDNVRTEKDLPQTPLHQTHPPRLSSPPHDCHFPGSFPCLTSRAFVVFVCSPIQ